MWRNWWRKMLTEARTHPVGSFEREYRRNAARKYGWLAKGIPTGEWPK